MKGAAIKKCYIILYSFLIVVGFLQENQNTLDLKLATPHLYAHGKLGSQETRSVKVEMAL